MESCHGHDGGLQGLGGGVTVVRECDSHQGGVSVDREVCWL